jgi:hypothetical protein
MTYDCYICKEVICKYGLDLGNTIRFGVKSLNGKMIYICDGCAKQIAMELVNR